MNSLSTRLFTAFLALIVLVILMISFTLIVLLRNNPLVQRLDLATLANASAAINRLDLAGLELRPAVAEARVQQLAATYNVRVLVTDSDGKILLDSALPDGPALLLRQFRTGRQDVLFPQATVGEVRDSRLQQWLYVARPFGTNRMLVTAALPRKGAAVVFFAEYLLLPMAESAGVAILVAMLLAVFVSRSIAQPLQKMATVAQGIAQGDYAKSAPESGPDEVRALGQALNSMKQQVQTSQQGQRDFLANVSHELKTPLTSIQGFAQALIDGAAATPEAIQRSANIIYSEADRMRRLVESLLELARLDAGLQTLSRASLDLRALLLAVTDRFGPRAHEQGVALTTELPPALTGLSGDADRLAQVFTNLVDNALKHTPAGGKVTVSAVPSPAWVEVSVSDTGPGIPAEDLGRIFERFYQVDKSRARRTGVGLGLTISKEIVEAHGGSLRVESVVGLGSRFVVRLPLARPEDLAAAKKR
jgi:signal transduction histidine kinase